MNKTLRGLAVASVATIAGLSATAAFAANGGAGHAEHQSASAAHAKPAPATPAPAKPTGQKSTAAGAGGASVVRPGEHVEPAPGFELWLTPEGRYLTWPEGPDNPDPETEFKSVVDGNIDFAAPSVGITANGGYVAGLYAGTDKVASVEIDMHSGATLKARAFHLRGKDWGSFSAVSKVRGDRVVRVRALDSDGKVVTSLGAPAPSQDLVAAAKAAAAKTSGGISVVQSGEHVKPAPGYEFWLTQDGAHSITPDAASGEGAVPAEDLHDPNSRLSETAQSGSHVPSGAVGGEDFAKIASVEVEMNSGAVVHGNLIHLADQDWGAWYAVGYQGDVPLEVTFLDSSGGVVASGPLN